MNNMSTEQYQELINDFIEEVTQYNPLYILKALYLYYFIYVTKKYPYLDFSVQKKEIISACLQYLISIYQSKGKKNNFTEVGNLYNLVNNIIEKFSKIYFEGLPITNAEDKSIDDFGKYIRENAEGISYPFITVEILCQLLRGQIELLQDIYSSTIDLDEFVKISFANLQLAKTVIFSDTLPEIFKRIDMLLPDDIFEVTSYSKLPKQLLIDLSYKVGEKEDFLERVEYSGWYAVEPPAKEKPFINIDDRVYSFHHNTTFDRLYRQIQRIVISKTKEYKTKWNINQNQTTEKLVADIISSIFVNPITHVDNFYKDGKDRFENDIIIQSGDCLLVVEVKAGGYTYRSVLTDEESHDKSIEALVDKGITQSERFIKQLNQNGHVDLYDNDGKQFASIKKQDYNFIFGLSVSIDHLNEITAGYYKRENDEFNVIPLSIYDLFIFKMYFDTSIEFVDYLRFRSDNMPDNVIVSDELSHLGVYITNPYIYEEMKQEFKEQDIGSIYLDPSNADFDSYFYDFPRLMPHKKPKRETSKTVKQLIKLLDKQNTQFKYKIGTHFYRGSKKQQIQLFEKIKEISFDGTKKKKTGFITLNEIKTAICIITAKNKRYKDIVPELNKLKNSTDMKHYIIIWMGKNLVINEIRVGNL